MDKDVLEVTKLYVTDRIRFKKQYSNSVNSKLVEALLDQVFLNSESRPDLAEQVALYILGYTPRQGKRGYDGYTKKGRPVEAKVRNAVSIDGKFPPGQKFSRINDVSQNIIDRYRADNPLFVFPYFFDGHFVAAYTIDYRHLDICYARCLEKHTKGRVSFTLSASYWLPNATLAYRHKSKLVQSYLPKIFHPYLS